ncbi:MAG TPA: thermosome subunit [Candidatus Bathyarchaeota archaeon]|nr:thermosome subunit [Candidatus Bathyarchaeota archaeon]
MAAPATGIPVLILKEGTTRRKGREALYANIMAARIVAEAIKTSLGPKGMDKMLVDSFGDVTITSDGRTILDEMEIEHPAAKMMVEVAKTQDDEVGDGTTTAVIVAGELLAQAEQLLDKNVHPVIILDGYRKAAQKALEELDAIAMPVDPKDMEVLKKVAMTAMASKLVAEHREHLAELAAEAMLMVAEEADGKFKVDVDDVKVEKKPGGSITDTQLVRGIVLDKEVVHPGMPKRVEKAKIALLNCPLEVEKTEFDAKIHIETPEQMEAFLKEEERMMREMVEKIKGVGANVVLCQKGIDDMVQHFLARAGILAVRRIKKSDMEKLAKATGARIVTNLDDLKPEDLGEAELVEERRVGEDKMVFVEGCKNPRSVTILIRGGSERVVDEAERSIHDALCVIKDVLEEPKIVAGGGAPELELAMRLRDWAEGLPGKEKKAVEAFASALESIPITLAENAGLDPIDIMSELTAMHKKGHIWAGIDVMSGCAHKDMREKEVLEPVIVKKQVIKSAAEAATMILKIDDVIAASRLKEKGPPKGPEEGEEAGAGGESLSEFS